MLPMATTTVSVLRLSDDQLNDEPYNEPAISRTVAHSGIRAHFSTPSGSETVAGGELSVTVYKVVTDPADITHLDWLKDERTNEVWRIDWISTRGGLGLDHMVGQVRLIEGLADI